jgi:endonuclease YncB( thermonuclease family)
MPCCFRDKVFAATPTGTVVEVVDDDTATVLANRTKHRVHLDGIDALERKQNAMARHPDVHFMGSWAASRSDKRDRYGRIIGVVRVRLPDTPCLREPCPKTLDAGLYQVTIGMAWWFRRYAHEQTPKQRAQYEVAERDAQSRRAGLWRDASGGGTA